MIGLSVDLDANCLRSPKGVVGLTTRGAEIVSVLLAAHPRPVPMRRLIAAVYGAAQAAHRSRSAISTIICQTRKRLRPLCLTILSDNLGTATTGYRLAVHFDPERSKRHAADALARESA